MRPGIAVALQSESAVCWDWMNVIEGGNSEFHNDIDDQSSDPVNKLGNDTIQIDS